MTELLGFPEDEEACGIQACVGSQLCGLCLFLTFLLMGIANQPPIGIFLKHFSPPLPPGPAARGWLGLGKVIVPRRDNVGPYCPQASSGGFVLPPGGDGQL